jgi:amino acid adenylation domain-containing protein
MHSQAGSWTTIDEPLSGDASAANGEPTNLVELLRRRALSQPNRVAYTFLLDGETSEVCLTFAELDLRAQAIGAWLQATGAAGERVLLLYPPGIEYIAAFFGCLYAGAVAVPAYPPRLNQKLFRIHTILEDASVSVVLTTPSILSKTESLFAHTPYLKTLRWVDTEGIASSLAAKWRDPLSGSDSLALLQYTSGSTAEPKGVMVSHGNLLYSERMIQTAFGQNEDSVIVGWLPLYHDMGLIGNVLQPLYVGGRCILMSPVAFLQRPLRWLEAISNYKATTSGGPNFAYDLCAQRTTPEQRATLDLSSWTVAFNGAEPVRAESMERFAELFAPCGFRREAFYPCYGLAEATLIVSGKEPGVAPTIKTVNARGLEQNQISGDVADDEAGRRLVGCGSTLLEQKIIIAHPQELTACASGEVGEIWVSGPNVAQGYWNKSDETERIFGAHLQATAEGPYLRTGDLGFLQDGELFVTGRLKDLIVIRGRNHYPQDIELTVERTHTALRQGCGAAFSVEENGEEYLVVVQELEHRQSPDLDAVIESIRQSLIEEYEVQARVILLVKAGSVPKTSSGKIQRHACRAAFQAESLEVLAQWNAPTATARETLAEAPATQLQTVETVEDWLVNRLAGMLGIASVEIDVGQPISRYGIDSLMAIELVHNIQATLGVFLPMTTFLQSSTIAQLAVETFDLLTVNSSATHALLDTTPEALAEYPLSPGQQSLWFMHQLAPESAAYNLAFASRLHLPTDPDALKRAFQALVERHPSLRTTFTAIQGEPVQQISNHAEVFFRQEDASGWTERDLNERLADEARRPFNLEEGPLMRVNIFTRSNSEQVVLLTLHHIIADFWSLAVLINELGILYEAEHAGASLKLAPLALPYTGYVRWQATMLAGPEGERLWSYWEKRLAGELPVLNLPVDRSRPPLQTYQGASHPFTLSAETSRRLKALGREHGATLYMTLLAAFQVLLHRYTAQEDILIGSPTAGRNWSELGGLIGYFVNPIALRADMSGNPTFEDFLDETRKNVLADFEHQAYPFAELVKRLQPERDPSRASLFQVMFALQKAHLLDKEGLSSFALGETGVKIKVGGLGLESMALEQRVALFDLVLLMAEVGDALVGSLQYNVDLFDHATIARISAHFQTLLEDLLAHPGKRISDLQMLTEVEGQQFENWNATDSAYSRQSLIHQLYEAQAALTPAAPAVVGESEQLSYRQLNERSNQVAHYLRALGVGPGVLVGVLMERSPLMVVALLGILKAGGAYVPLDPAYPKQRLTFMLRDAKSKVLLTQRRLAAHLSRAEAKIVSLDSDWQLISLESVENLNINVNAADQAYVIYTSGSTGQPKGVQIQHGALLNLVFWHRRAYAVSSSDRATQLAGVGFDASVWELWPYLSAGASIHLPDDETRATPAKLRDWLIAENVTLAFLPTPLAESILALEWPAPSSLRTLLTGGDRLRSYPAPSLGFELVNHYGPTEYTVVACAGLVPPARQESETLPPIGRPIDNTQVYLLDSQLRRVPIGVHGELHLGGDSLSTGYLYRPELTAERFIPNPFSRETGARLYRTGDLARWLPDGQIEFLGRLDYQVKVRGFRIELGEVETILASHPDIREAIVMTREDAGEEKRLVAYVVTDQEHSATLSDLRNFLKERVPDYMVPSALVRLEAMPLTANGKIDRLMLPAPDLTRPEIDEAFMPPRTPVEEALIEIWVQVLGIERVGIQDNFFDLGGHSLLATQVISRVREAFKIELPLRKVFEEPTVAGLASSIEAAFKIEPGVQAPAMQAIARDRQLPLSFAQQRLWFLDQLEPGSPLYNIPAAVRLEGRLNIDALLRSFHEIRGRHESLRTHFAVVEGDPVQVISADAAWRIEEIDLSALPELEREGELTQLGATMARDAFDLSKGPLLRACLARLAADEHVLFLTMHHIISDGWSMGVLIRELAVLYEALSEGKPSPLPELPIQYADFAVWQREWLQSENLEAHLSYWKQQLGGDLPVLELATDFPRPSVRTHRGARRSLALPATLTESLKAMSLQEGVTLYMTLLAAFQTLLYKYTGQTDMVVGTPIAGRNRTEIEGLIGLFINTLVMRTDLSGNPTFRELLARAQEVALGAYAHQELPFEQIVQEFQLERGLSQNPLFQVMLILQNVPTPELELSDLRLSLLETENETAKFDLTLTVEDRGHGLAAVLEYNADLFSATTAERMLDHFQILLEGIVADPSQRLAALPLLTETERQQQLLEWNDTRSDYPTHQTIQHLFEEQAAQTPDAIAVVDEQQQWSYRALNERANQLAHYLKKLGIGPESLVGIYVDRSFEMVAGLLGILKAGGAYLPLDAAYPKERLAFMIEDAGLKTLLTQSNLVESLPPHEAAVLCLDTDRELMSGESIANPPCAAMAVNTAYVIYTSGSTGKPKGVQVPHRAVANLLNAVRKNQGLTREDVLLAVTTLSFDIAALEIFLPLTTGARLVLVSREMASDGARLSDKVTSSGATIMQATPTTWRMLFEAGWKGSEHFRILCGGEALTRDLADQLLTASRTAWDLYGPTETTIWSTAGEIGTETLNIGRPLDNTQVFVMRQDLQLVPAGAHGELHIGGNGVAHGYLHRPELTAQQFIPNPFSETPGARLYKTGDLVRYLPDGKIEYLGRIDQQVKVRGFRIELGEIETALKQHESVSAAVVAAKDDAAGGKLLVAYLIFHDDSAAADSSSIIGELRSLLKSLLPDYMMPAAFVILQTMPLTPNGKVDRRALPAPDQSRPETQTSFVAPRTLTEQMLATVWSAVLRLESVGINDNFFELGGHSLLATRLISKVRELFQVEIPLRRLFETPTIAGLAGGIESATRAGTGLQAPPIKRVARENPSPLSFAQERLWILDQLEPGNPTYNLPVALRLKGALNQSALARSLQEIVRRHEPLRSTFAVADNKPVQFIAPAMETPLRVLDIRTLSEALREKEALRLRGEEAQLPFNLATGPLFRPTLLRLSEDDYELLLTMHHIVSDGWSISVLVRELTELYQDYCAERPLTLSELPIQYGDFVAWQRQWFQSDVLETELSYWRQQLKDANVVIDLPADSMRPPIQSFRGEMKSLQLAPSLAESLKTLSQQNDATLFMTLLAAFKVLLYKYTGQEDILVGSPIAGRNRAELEGLIGLFLNTLTLRTDLSGAPSFNDLVKRVREVTLGAYTHQDLPFEKLLEELKPKRDLSRTPLFQVFFNMFNFADTKIDMPDLKIKLLAPPAVLSKFDLTLYVEDWEKDIKFDLVYNADLFEEDRMAEMLEQFNCLLGQITAHPEEQINNYSLITRTAIEILPDPARPLRDDWEGAVHTRFSAQARRVKARTAVSDKDDVWSYEELDTRANQLANYLRSNGVNGGDVVAIYAHRSATLVWALLGILKAGAAFIVLDPAYPSARLMDFLRVSPPSGWLEIEAAGALPSALEEFVSDLHLPCRLTLPRRAVAAASGFLKDYSAAQPMVEVGPDDLAYVAFTSGSTGMPKGIQGRHGPLTHFQPWVERTFNLSETDRFSLLSGLSHDPLHRDVFTPLQMGAAVCIPDPEDIGVPGRLPEWMNEEGITITHLTPAMAQLLTEAPAETALCEVRTLRYAFLVGDVLTRRDVARLRQLSPSITTVNYYGSTETQRAVSYFVVSEPQGQSEAALTGRLKEILPLGKGIEDVQLLVLNPSMQLAGIGEVGEVYVRSPHLARGYKGDDALTRARFLSNPFGQTADDRLYKTGDLGRYMPDGNVEPLGRADLQVKIRGFRVELGEIEAVLGTHRDVREAIVIAREDIPGDKRLVAYIVGQENQTSTGSELRSFLKGKLPDYMLPAAFVILEALPLTPNGKVNRRELPAPDEMSAENQSGYVAPRSPLEQRLADIWAEVLHLERVGIHQNFFDLGGHSLLATQLISRLQDAFQVKLSLRSFFVSPTVAELAITIGQVRAEQVGSDEIARLLAELEQLSEESAAAEVNSSIT